MSREKISHDLNAIRAGEISNYRSAGIMAGLATLSLAGVVYNFAELRPLWVIGTAVEIGGLVSTHLGFSTLSRTAATLEGVLAEDSLQKSNQTLTEPSPPHLHQI